MAREKFSTLTEQMFYILLCLRQENCGVDIMKLVEQLTRGRVQIGPGTLYSLLDNFVKEGLIEETKTERRKKSYLLSAQGAQLLEREYLRLQQCQRDYEAQEKGDASNA